MFAEFNELEFGFFSSLWVREVPIQPGRKGELNSLIFMQEYSIRPTM